MSTQTKDLPGTPATATTAPAATNLRGRKPDPVCIDIPVQVRAIEGLPVPGSDEVPKAFREDTRTLIVFQHGGVLRMTTKVKRGQMLAVTHVKSGQEVPCRVVNVRSSGPTEEYVEVEFTQRVSAFWGIHFPSEPLNEHAETAREKAEADKIAAEEAARAHAARVDTARVEAEATEAIRRQTTQAGAEKLAAEKVEKEKAAARFAAGEKAAAERLEAAKLAEQVAAQRAETERIAVQREAKRREDAARREAEREAELAEQQRLVEMRAAAENLAAERAEAERRAAELAAAQEKAAAERAAEEIAAKERERAQKLEAEKAAKEKAQAEARGAREKKAKEVEETRAILAKVETERRAAELAAAERSAQEKEAAERMATEKAADTVLGYGMSAAGLPSPSQEKAQAAREKAAKEKPEALRLAVEAAAAEKAARRAAEEAEKQLFAEKAVKARAEKERKTIVARLDKERIRNEKAAAAKIEAEEKKAAKQLQAESRAPARSGAAVGNILFANAEEIVESSVADETEDTTAVDDAGEEARPQARTKNSAVVLGSLGAEIAHDRSELRARAKSRSTVALGIAASALMLLGGGAWWLFLGPGAAARDKAALTDSAASHSPVNSQVNSQITSSANSSANSPAASQMPQDASPASMISGASGAAASDAKAADRTSATPARPYGGLENKVSGAANEAAKNSSANSLGGKVSRPLETASRAKDAPIPADNAAAGAIGNKNSSEAAHKVTARPALEATLRAPVKVNSTRSAGAGDAVPLPDVRGASSVMNGAEASLQLGGSSGATNPIAPPPPTGGNVVPGRLLKSVPPQYPDLARQRHVEGDVIVRADVDTKGNVVLVTPLNGPDLLRSAATSSVKQWKYSPALLNGQPVAMQVQVTVKFRSAR